MLTPVLVTIITFDVPLTPTVTLLSGEVIETLLVPLMILLMSRLPAINVPVTDRFPIVELPVALTAPPVTKLPPVMFPVAVTSPLVVKLPPITFPVAVTTPPVVKLPPIILPVTVTTPAVPKLPTLAFAVALNVVAYIPTVPTLPMLALPDTDTVVSVPTLVILDCAASTTVLAVIACTACVALGTEPVTLAPVIDVSAEPLPLTLVKTPFVAPILPTLALPTTLNVASEPTAVIFDCVAFVTRPAYAA